MRRWRGRFLRTALRGTGAVRPSASRASTTRTSPRSTRFLLGPACSAPSFPCRKRRLPASSIASAWQAISTASPLPTRFRVRSARLGPPAQPSEPRQPLSTSRLAGTELLLRALIYVGARIAPKRNLAALEASAIRARASRTPLLCTVLGLLDHDPAHPVLCARQVARGAVLPTL